MAIRSEEGTVIWKGWGILIDLDDFVLAKVQRIVFGNVSETCNVSKDCEHAVRKD